MKFITYKKKKEEEMFQKFIKIVINFKNLTKKGCPCNDYIFVHCCQFLQISKIRKLGFQNIVIINYKNNYLKKFVGHMKKKKKKTNFEEI